MRAAPVLLVAIAVSPPLSAVAAPPSVTIASPLNGSVSNNQTPSFSGIAEAGVSLVTLRLYKGPTAEEGAAIQELTTLPFPLDAWSLELAKPLEGGTYTARASQTNLASETGKSSPVTFTVDTAAPTVTLNSPESPSSNATPSFTGNASDTTPVIVWIHAGATPEGTVVSRATATGTGTGWTSGGASPALASGQYTALATQASSLLGNPSGRSAPVTFTVTPPPVTAAALLAPPAASFKWFPELPDTGEPVSLVSSSTDAGSPITGFAWALAGNGFFQGGGATLTTSFSTPGAHVVRLRVSDAAGRSSVATETIDVLARTAPVMQPFPVVRIAGTVTGSGIRIRLLKVQQMPAGVRITVRCRGHGCPTRSVRRLTVSSARGVAPVEFRAFERTLRFGVTLEILVTAPGKIGKYTRFAIRRGRLPERVDMCLDPAGVRLVCPSS